MNLAYGPLLKGLVVRGYQLPVVVVIGSLSWASTPRRQANSLGPVGPVYGRMSRKGGCLLHSASLIVETQPGTRCLPEQSNNLKVTNSTHMQSSAACCTENPAWELSVTGGSAGFSHGRGVDFVSGRG